MQFKKIVGDDLSHLENELIYDVNFKNIPKEEQVPNSRLALQKSKKEKTMVVKENTENQMNKKLAITSMAKQGKRSVSDHSSPPLSRTKIIKKKKEIVGI